MEEYINQIREGLKSNLYYLSLVTTLTIPDICCGLASEDSQSSPFKYKDWFNKNLGSKYLPDFSGEDCWDFRCTLLHQNRTGSTKGTYQRILFLEPGQNNILHCNIVNGAFNIDVRIFCNDILNAAEAWLKTYESDPIIQKNMCNLVKRYPNVLQPFISGCAVIA